MDEKRLYSQIRMIAKKCREKYKMVDNPYILLAFEGWYIEILNEIFSVSELLSLIDYIFCYVNEMDKNE